MLPQRSSAQEVNVSMSDTSVSINLKHQENDQCFQAVVDQCSMDVLSNQIEECKGCPFHMKLGAKTLSYHLHDGEMLHDFEGSTASSQTISQFMDSVASADTLKIMNLHKRMISKDCEKCTSSFQRNINQNRFADIPCFEDTRVKVQHPSMDTAYINASWVDGYQERKKFIVTQTPASHNFVQFWKMIWQEKTLLVVCMSRMYDLVKRDEPTCYIPKKAGEVVTCGEFKIVNTGVNHVRGTYDATSLNISINSETRKFLHICYYAWDNNEIPTKPTELLKVVLDVNHNRALIKEKAIEEGTIKKGERFPILVHCLSGIGTSCTFVALDILINKLDDTHKRATIQPLADVTDTVKRLRNQRAMAIQKPGNFLLLHLLVCEHAVRNNYADKNAMASFNLNNFLEFAK